MTFMKQDEREEDEKKPVEAASTTDAPAGAKTTDSPASASSRYVTSQAYVPTSLRGGKGDVKDGGTSTNVATGFAGDVRGERTTNGKNGNGHNRDEAMGRKSKMDFHNELNKLLDPEEREKLKIRQVVLCGDTSSGKSTIANFLLGCNINHVGLGVATRRPCVIRVTLANSTTFKITFKDHARYATGYEVQSIEQAHEIISELNDAQGPFFEEGKEFDKRPIFVEVTLGGCSPGSEALWGGHSSLEIVDTPGATAKSDEPLSIVKGYMQSQNLVIVMIGMENHNNAKFPDLLEMSANCSKTFVIQNFARNLLRMGPSRVWQNYDVVKKTLCNNQGEDAAMYCVDPGPSHTSDSSDVDGRQEDWALIQENQGHNVAKERMRHHEEDAAESTKSKFQENKIMASDQRFNQLGFGLKTVIGSINEARNAFVGEEISRMSQTVFQKIDCEKEQIVRLKRSLEELVHSPKWEELLESYATYASDVAQGCRGEDLPVQSTEAEIAKAAEESQTPVVFTTSPCRDKEIRDLMDDEQIVRRAPGFREELFGQASHNRLNQELLCMLACASMRALSQTGFNEEMMKTSQGITGMVDTFVVVCQFVFDHGGIRIADMIRVYKKRFMQLANHTLRHTFESWWEDEGKKAFSELLGSNSGQEQKSHEDFKRIAKDTLEAFAEARLEEELQGLEDIGEWLLPIKHQLFNGQRATKFMKLSSTAEPHILPNVGTQRKWNDKYNDLLPPKPPTVGIIPSCWAFLDPVVKIGMTSVGFGKISAGAKVKIIKEAKGISFEDKETPKNTWVNACPLTNVMLLESAIEDYKVSLSPQPKLVEYDLEVFKYHKAWCAEIASNWASRYPAMLQTIQQSQWLKEGLQEVLDRRRLNDKDVALLLKHMDQGDPEDAQTSQDEYIASGAKPWQLQSSEETMEDFYKTIGKVEDLRGVGMLKFKGTSSQTRLCEEFQFVILHGKVPRVKKNERITREAAKCGSRVGCAVDEQISELARQRAANQIEHIADAFRQRFHFLLTCSAKFAVKQSKISGLEESHLVELVMGKLEETLQKLIKDVQALKNTDFALMNGRIAFVEDGLPMGNIYCQPSDKKNEISVDHVQAANLFQKVWTQSDDVNNPLICECDEKYMQLSEESAALMFKRTRKSNIDFSIAKAVDAVSSHPPGGDQGLVGGWIHDVALRIFKCFHVHAIFMLRPRMHTLCKDVYDKEKLAKTLRRNDGLMDLKKAVLENQRTNLEQEITRLEKLVKKKQDVLNELHQNYDNIM